MQTLLLQLPVAQSDAAVQVPHCAVAPGVAQLQAPVVRLQVRPVPQPALVVQASVHTWAAVSQSPLAQSVLAWHAAQSGAAQEHCRVLASQV